MEENELAQRDRVGRPTKRRRAVAAKEREAIIVASIEGLSQPEIAEKFGRSPHTVRAILRSEAGKKRTAELLQDAANAARSILCRSVGRAAKSWLKQLELVDEGKRGNHLPSRDLLTHVGVIGVPAPKKKAEDQITIQIGCGSDAEFIPIEEPEPDPPTGPRQITFGPVDSDATPVEES
jgi:transcriptional regulator with XRE-family HTH domain